MMARALGRGREIIRGSSGWAAPQRSGRKVGAAAIATHQGGGIPPRREDLNLSGRRIALRMRRALLVKAVARLESVRPCWELHGGQKMSA